MKTVLNCDIRARKVKCDETFPVCRRCSAAVRNCAGYGIWGGGGNHDTRTSQSNEARPQVGNLIRPPRVKLGNEDDVEHFDWIRHYATIKIPGTFRSRFWTTLVLQISMSEPAVLHALLALSSYHRQCICHSHPQSVVQGRSLNNMEQFALQHYNRAIRTLLQPAFSVHTYVSSRITLIVCLVFVSIDLLRGHFTAAQQQLHSGLELLAKVRSHCDMLVSQSCTPTDIWILEMFCRFRTHMEFFYLLSGNLTVTTFSDFELQTTVPGFVSINGAWLGLDRIFDRIVNLCRLVPPLKPLSSPAVESGAILRIQQDIQRDLASWLHTLEALREGSQSYDQATDAATAIKLLQDYHTVATIMVNVSLCPGQEEKYDEQTHLFLRLIRSMADSAASAQNNLHASYVVRHNVTRHLSIIDLGWLPILYYVAVKCRISRIRSQAVKLMEFAPHQEGIWDSGIMACICRKVIEIEQGDFSDNVDFHGAPVITSYPSLHDASVPRLPTIRRICIVQILLLGAPVHTIVLRYQSCGSEAGYPDQILFHISAQAWTRSRE